MVQLEKLIMDMETETDDSYMKVKLINKKEKQLRA